MQTLLRAQAPTPARPRQGRHEKFEGGGTGRHRATEAQYRLSSPFVPLPKQVQIFMTVRRLQRSALLLTLALLSGLLLWSPTALAAGTPNISAEINSPTVLHGASVPVTITARNPTGQPYGYNLSFRVVLPPGVSYAGRFATPPTEIAGPGAGERTLIFRNVSDLSPNSSFELGFEVAYDPTRYDVGDTFQIRAEAFINSQPRDVPVFGAGGVYQSHATGNSGEVVGTTTINAIEVEKDEPSPEGEILRGVHDEQTVYTVSVRNNGIRPTDGVTLVDYVPAGLEFLGCGGTNADNTTNTSTNNGEDEEYPDSGAIVVPALSPCVAPVSVETVDVDPDGAGPMPRAVYTKVTWPVGTLASGERREFRYRAAIPIRENTMTWNGATPATTGAQATNLDNNNGPEVRDEAVIRNYATASGRYDNRIDVRDETTLTRTAEDWRVLKSADRSELEQGALTWWTLTFDTSEYRSVRDAVVTDTLPNGFCPLGATNLAHTPNARDDECKATGELPTAPYKSAVENADGTWTLTWDKTVLPALAHVDVSTTVVIRFPTRTRTDYQSNFEPSTPILTRDAVENSVTTRATAVVRCTPDSDANCTGGGPEIWDEAGYGTGTELPDASQAGQVATQPRIEKLVAASGTRCETATYVKTVPGYHPGDTVCWKLRIEFPARVDTRPQVIRDFLPDGATYVAGSDRPTAANRVGATIDTTDAADGVLVWRIDTPTVDTGTLVFERYIQTVVKEPTTVTGEIQGNLMKFSSLNTAGVSVPLRDLVEIRLDSPVVRVVKGVQSIVRGASTVEGPNAANRDHRLVQAGDSVTFRVDVTNDGAQDATDVTVRDLLPTEFRCVLPGVSGISHSGSCTDDFTPGRQSRIDWTIPTIAAGATVTLTYTVTVPNDVRPNQLTMTNLAGVRSYVGRSNSGIPANDVTYYPANNIDPAVTTPNAPRADDPSDVYTRDATITKSRTTSVDRTADGNTAGQATIGEEIEYTVVATIPAGTRARADVVVTDTLDDPVRQRFVTGSARADVTGTAATYTLDTSGVTPAIRFDGDVTVPAGTTDARITLRFKVIVTDVAGNTRTSGNLTNRARLSWTGGSKDSNTVTTEIVEPLLSQRKGDNRNPDRVAPRDIVTYTVTTTNGLGSPGRVSTAHDVRIVDTIPRGLTPVDAAGDPLIDGATVNGVVWDLRSRTLTMRVAAIAPGASDGFTYRARVDDPATGGSELTNVVVATAASLPLTPETQDRRTSASTTRTGYEASARDTIRIAGPRVTKTVTPADATIGNTVTYTVTTTIPSDLRLFDVTTIDTLPAELAFGAYGTAATCVSGCAAYTEPSTYNPVVNANGTTTLGWSFGDVPTPLTEPLVIRTTYTAVVRDQRPAGADVVRGDTAVNTATVYSNRADRDTFDPARVPTAFDDRSPETRATVRVVEPKLSIDKQVKVSSGSFVDGPATARSNDALTYQLTIRNSGDASAYDVVVRDTPDVELTNVVVDTDALDPGVTLTKAWSAADREMRWLIAGPIPANGEIRLVYTADLVAARDLSDGQEIDNTASVPRYWGVPVAGREPVVDYREYTDGGSDSTKVVLDFPTLTLEKTTGLSGNPDTGDAEVGRAFLWRIVVRNTSTTATARDVVVTDTLPANWTYDANSAVLTPGGASEPAVDDRELSWTIATLAPGASVTIALRAIPGVAAATTPGLDPAAHVNDAAVTSARDEAGNPGNRDGEYGTPSDSATATLRVPQLTIDKTPDNGTAVAGQGSSFTIVVENTGTATAENLVVTDVLPRGLRYAANAATAVPTAGFSETSVTPDAGSGRTTIVWAIASLAAGARVTITLPVSVGADVANDAELVNVAGVRSEEVPTEVRDDGRIRVGTRADLSIVKDGAPRYTAGTNYTWRLKVRNHGPSVARDVVVDDALPAGTRFVSVSDSRCEEQPAGSGAVACAFGDLAVDAEIEFSIVVSVDPATDVDPLRNTATVDSDTDDPTPGNNEDSHDAEPDPFADVTVVKTATPAAINRGHQSTFTLTVTNLGPSVARDVELEDPLPSGLEFVSVSDARCTELSGTIRCAFGDLPVNTPISFQIVVRGTLEGEWRNVAEVRTTTPEPTTHEPNRDDAAVVVGPVADLGVEKSGPATVAAGGRITWDLTVTNHGDDPATGVVLTDTLPQGVEFVSASPGCTLSDRTVSCDIGPLAVGERQTRQITANAPIAVASTTLVNAVVVSGDQPDENPANDRDEATTEVGPSSDLGIVKSGPATAAAGGSVAWTLLVTNHGPSAATGVVVADALPEGVAFVSASPAQGTCSAVGRQVSCAVGALAVGASTQIQVVGQIAPELENATVVNVAAVTGEQPDHNPGNNRSEAPTRIGPPETGNFDLAIAKTIQDAAKPALGQVFTYALTVTNIGPATATNVNVTDTLPSAVRGISVAGTSCTLKGAVVRCALGTMRAGESATIAVKVRAIAAGKAVRNEATVSSDVADRDPSNDRAEVTVPIAAPRSNVAIVKTRLGRGGVGGGRTVRYRIKVTNTSRNAAANVTVCDRVPEQLSIVKAGGGKLRRGDLCWNAGLLLAKQSRTYQVTMRLNRDVRPGTIRNVATVRAGNAPTRKSRADIRSTGPAGGILPGFGRGGGVTG